MPTIRCPVLSWVCIDSWYVSSRYFPILPKQPITPVSCFDTTNNKDYNTLPAQVYISKSCVKKIDLQLVFVQIFVLKISLSSQYIYIMTTKDSISPKKSLKPIKYTFYDYRFKPPSIFYSILDRQPENVIYQKSVFFCTFLVSSDTFCL